MPGRKEISTAPAYVIFVCLGPEALKLWDTTDQSASTKNTWDTKLMHDPRLTLESMMEVLT